MAVDASLVAKVTSLLAASSTTSAVSVIQLVTRATSSKEEAVAVLRQLAAGQDGVQGTSDDVIPAAVVEVLAYLIQSGVAEDIVAIVAPMFPCAPALRVLLKPLKALWSLLAGR